LLEPVAHAGRAANHGRTRGRADHGCAETSRGCFTVCGGIVRLTISRGFSRRCRGRLAERGRRRVSSSSRVPERGDLRGCRRGADGRASTDG
jgi:hypothetical protein